MAADHWLNGLGHARTAIAAVVYPAQHAAGAVAAYYRQFSSTLAVRDDLLEENETLRREQLLMRARLQRLDSLQAENQRLKTLMGAAAVVAGRTTAAELTGVALDPFRRQVAVSKGLREGVYRGQPVIDADGVMGQVIHAGPFSSTVLLITDANHSMPVQLNRNGLRSIAVGAGRNDALWLEYLPVNADVRVGDLVVSSGLGGRFPRGYPVGEVASITHTPGEPFFNVSVTPSARFEQNREVLLVWPHARTRQAAAPN